MKDNPWVLADHLCFNCDKPVTEPKLFCSLLCQEEGKTVRYIRAVTRDGRINQLDAAEAVKIRKAILLGGGYPRQKRRLSPEVRQVIFERDTHKCQVCGGQATEIDHLDNSLAEGVNEPANHLQPVSPPEDHGRLQASQ